MSGKLQIADFGICLKDSTKGKLNNICDVPGVKVGHCTIDKDDSHTGVTVILPCEDNIFEKKMPAAAVVLPTVRTPSLSTVPSLAVLL